MLSYPSGLAFDRAGNLYIADTGNGRIRKIDRGGVITAFGGGGTDAFASGVPAGRVQRGLVLTPPENGFVGEERSIRN